MNIKKYLVDFVVVFTISLIVSVSVTWLWNMVVHGTSALDWETSASRQIRAIASTVSTG